MFDLRQPVNRFFSNREIQRTHRWAEKVEGEKELCSNSLVNRGCEWLPMDNRSTVRAIDVSRG
jgi:hypothetical protein